MVEKNQNRNKNNIKKVSKDPKRKEKNINTLKSQLTTKKVASKRTADEKSARAKKGKSLRKFFTWTILIGIIVGILVFLCKSELFEIVNIEVTGNSQISQETILKLSEIDLKDNIFLTNTIKAKNQISQNSYIKEVKISRVLPDKIKIEIIEKQKAYLIQLDEGFAYIDKNGYILEISGTKLDKLIVLQGYSTKNSEIEVGKTLNQKDLERLEDVQKILQSSEKNSIKDKIASINIKDKNDYILNLPTYKKIIYIGDTSNLSTKILRAKDIIDKTMDKEGKIFVNGQFNKGFDPYFREEVNN